jgi:predicted negative regulator of RcsB-dependent stress response
MDNSTHNDTELLIRYLDGELWGKEKDAIEQRLSEQTDLQKELESLRLSREAVRSYGLKKQVSDIHAVMKKELRTPVRQISGGRKFARYSLAVAASLLIIVITVLGYNFYTLSPAKVFSSNYQPYELSTMRDGEGQISLIEKAYRQKNYPEVVRLTKDQQTPGVKELFLAAMAQTELKNYSGAIENYQQLMATNKAAGADIMMAETEYYLALVYIRNKDYDQALELMNKIHDDPTHPYHEKITGKLIRKVKMLKWR